LTQGIFRIDSYGRWTYSADNECIDYVLRGCYNNGTCIAPDVCACAEVRFPGRLSSITVLLMVVVWWSWW
jgi:hypothetical protein